MFQLRYEREIITLERMAGTEWARGIFSNAAASKKETWFHMEQTANWLWTLRLQGFGSERGIMLLQR